MSQPAATDARRFRFSLRALLAACALVAAILGALFHRMREEQRHVDAIVAAGGRINYDQDLLSPARRYRPTTHWWRRFGGLSRPMNAWLKGQEITDDILINHLGRISSLEWVVVHDSAATEQGLKVLAHFKSLSLLSVHGKVVTDKVLEEQFSRLTQLNSLHLVDVAVTDAGLRFLAPLKSLKGLNCFRDDRNAAVAEELREGTTFATQDLPLDGLLEYLADAHHQVRFKINEANLSAAGIHPSVVGPLITCNVKNVTLAEGLDAALGPHGMTWLISEGSVLITSREAASKNRQLLQDLRAAHPSLVDLWVDWVPDAKPIKTESDD